MRRIIKRRKLFVTVACLCVGILIALTLMKLLKPTKHDELKEGIVVKGGEFSYPCLN